jgi:hypothetical protein
MATSHATSVRSGTAAAAPAAPSTSTGSAAGLHHHTAPHQWLTASEAQLRLRCDAFTLGRLIAQGALHAYRAPAQGLIFRLDELDGTPVPLAAEDALPLLAGASPDPGDPSVMTTTQNPRGEPSCAWPAREPSRPSISMPIAVASVRASSSASRRCVST